MAQNNSLFVRKTSNYSRGRLNLRNDMNQVTNLKSLGFTRERITNLLGGFPEVVLCDIDRLQWFLWCCFWCPYFFNRPFCGRTCCKTSIICISYWSRWFTNTNPKKLTAFTSPPSTFIVGNSLPNSCVADGCWFSFISRFVMFTKSISDCTIFFGPASLLIIVE